MPQVSIIVPCFNEQATIRLLLSAINAQTYAREDMEVIIADGISTDRTREEIALFQGEYPDLKVKIVDNLKLSATLYAHLFPVFGLRRPNLRLQGQGAVESCIDLNQEGLRLLQVGQLAFGCRRIGGCRVRGVLRGQECPATQQDH